MLCDVNVRMCTGGVVFPDMYDDSYTHTHTHRVFFSRSLAVPEVLDRKHFHQEGMCLHTARVQRPAQVNAHKHNDELSLDHVTSVT